MPPTLHQLHRLLPKTMTADRSRLFREWNRLNRELPRLGKPEEENRNAEKRLGPLDPARAERFDADLAKLAQRIEKSVDRAKARREKIPEIRFDSELPVCRRKEEIAKLIKENQVVVVCGETGSGKSTQLPKICLELGRGVCGMIGHTQPRRLAARAVARRVAEELKTPLGDGVGFKVRFTDETGEGTFVKVMTDGVLLAESQRDPFFEAYDTIIIDEAHERSLNIDFLLGMMKRVLARRRDFRLIITSATIDARRFAEHFSTRGKPAPIIEVSGRTYPIEIRYRPPDELFLEEDEDDPSHVRRREYDEGELRDRAFLAAVDELAREGRGDILVFLPTQRDILETAKLLKHHLIPGDDAVRKTEILPLYARLSFADQQKIFTKSRWRKIVLATNVAESSLTVPGIRYVIDFGTARISRYSSRSRTQRLPVEPISRASADQRAGRCGRVGPGICIRLYAETDYNGRDEFTTPEIRRTNLASVILQTIAYHLGAIEKFPFLDTPARGTIQDGYRTLFELGAIDEQQKITDIGLRLSRIPVDPRLGRMILAGMDEGVLDEILVIASVLEIQDPRERPLESAAKADEAHEPFQDSDSDFISYIKLWDFWQGLKEKLSGSQLRKACHQNFLSFNRMREWSDIYVQIHRLLRESKMIPNGGRLSGNRDDYDAIHRSILTGMLIGIGQRNETGEYVIAGGNKFGIWPGSGLFRKKYAWVVSAERVETNRRYLRCAAKIKPEWIEPLAGHLLTKKVFDPFWLRETGCVHAWQSISLFGLVIVQKRRIHFGPTDPAKARAIFIEHALVQEDFDCLLDFYRRNKELLKTAAQVQAKLREYSFLKGEDARRAFYEERIPADVYDKKTLTRWYESLPRAERRKLLFTFDDICARTVEPDVAERFPDEMTAFSGVSVPLDYRFEPGEKEDGLTATLQPDEFGALYTANRFGWLVPGLLEQKILFLLKSLPKEIRRPLVPMPETAALLVSDLEFGGGDFIEALARKVSRLANRLVTPADFDLSRVPEPLRLNIRVVDDAGNVLIEGRDPDLIRKELGDEISKTITAVSDSRWVRDNLTGWDFGSLPESVTLKRDKMALTASPGLVAPRFLNESGHDSAGISLRLFDTPEKAAEQTRRALIVHFASKCRRDLKYQLDHLPNADRIRMRLGNLPNFRYAADSLELAARFALEAGMKADENGSFPIPRSEGEYNKLMSAGERSIVIAAQDLARWLPPLADAFCEARLCAEKNQSPLFQEAGADTRELFDRLFEPGFHLVTPTRWLKEYPRYLKAVPCRYEKLRAGGSAADRASSAELAGRWARCFDLKAEQDAAGILDPEWPLYRWMIEEYQVSLFAQRLGTAVKVSAVRLDRQWEKLAK